ncbi:MAG: ABC transporter ATP-binding protein [Deltaproteobacteria bacterium]|nr:ABC transporter ATP-binding protein [Deltaproteobacteria bacterium]
MILEVKDLHSYYGKSHVLQGVEFSMKAGQVVCLLGRNGVGKSTTLKSIMGLVQPRRGKVLFQGRELSGKAPFEIARLGVGYVPEERRIFKSLTVMENLLIGVKAPRQTKGIGAWTVEQVFDSFPILAERRHHKGGRLSGGEQQMLTIARTLMGNPDLLLVDEPTEGLAPMVAAGVLRMLATIKAAGVTTLMVEQNYRAAFELGNSFHIMSKGRIVFRGNAEELLAAEDVRMKYLEV